MAVRKNPVRTALVIGSYICLIAYLLLLVKLIILKYLDLPDIMIRLRSDYSFRPYNLHPFSTIYAYYLYDSMPLWRRLGNVFGNIGIFMPIGLMLPLLIRWMRHFGKSLLVIFCLSLLFESLQYLLATGSADIDDLILNTVGGAAGYGIYRVISSFLVSRNMVLLASLSLFLIMMLMGTWVMLKEFGMDLGFRNQDTPAKTVSVSYEYADTNDVVWRLPSRDEDVMGKLVCVEDSIVSLNEFKIIDLAKEEEKQGYNKAMIMTPGRNKTPVHKYYLSSATVFIRKDVKQLSNTNFIIDYRKGYKDSIPPKSTVQFWLADSVKKRIDTLCYWVQKPD